jgi:Zn finger protein HypA/HybF involved in hydrogenase expression
LINAKALKIEGGEVAIKETKSLRCPKCRKVFNVCREEEDSTICPHCKKADIK